MESATKNNPQLHKPKKRKTKVEATISMHKEEPDKNAPTLGYYSSGFDPLTRIKKNPDSSSNPIKLYRNQNKSSRVEVVIKPKRVEVDFVGTSHGGDGAVLRMNSFALGVLDKSAQTLTISPVNANKVFRLQPLARASHMYEKEPDTPAKDASVEDTRDQKNSLLKLYGTKTAITKARKAMELRRHADDGSQEMRQAIENAPIDKEAIDSSNKETPRDIPPHDLSATLPEKAYLLEKIITKGEWAYVRDILDLLQAGKEIKSDVYPRFVCNRYYKVEITKDEAEKEKLAGIMSYIAYLIRFKNRYTLDGRDGSSSSKQPTFIPDMLLMKFKKMFLDTEKNRLADQTALISYVLVLTLFIDEFQTDFTDIAKDLKTESLKVRSQLKNLGCKFKRRNDVFVAHLPVPLKFPTLMK